MIDLITSQILSWFGNYYKGSYFAQTNTKQTKFSLPLTSDAFGRPMGSRISCCFSSHALSFWRESAVGSGAESGEKRKRGLNSETRLLRTLKGNEDRYVVTKVRSIKNTIFLTGRTDSTCSRERSATEDASPYWMSFITRFSYGEITFQGIVNLKTCREIEIETERLETCDSWLLLCSRHFHPFERLDDMLVIRKKRTKERAKKCSWRENWYVISDFVPRSVRLIQKNVHVFRMAMSVIDGENVITKCTY